MPEKLKLHAYQKYAAKVILFRTCSGQHVFVLDSLKAVDRWIKEYANKELRS